MKINMAAVVSSHTEVIPPVSSHKLQNDCSVFCGVCEVMLLASVSYVTGFVPFVKIIVVKNSLFYAAKDALTVLKANESSFVKPQGLLDALPLSKDSYPVSSGRFLWAFRIMLPHLKNLYLFCERTQSNVRL